MQEQKPMPQHSKSEPEVKRNPFQVLQLLKELQTEFQKETPIDYFEHTAEISDAMSKMYRTYLGKPPELDGDVCDSCQRPY